MKRFLVLILPVALALAACAPAASPARPTLPAPTAAPTQSVPADQAPTVPTFPPAGTDTGLTRIDEQGMIVVEVTPANLDAPADTLEFDVVMNTHSVDLGMDLAALSILTTDTGVTVQPLRWDAPPGGGHHLSGKLIFPSAVDGKSILDGASKLTLSIANVDAPSRTFEWDLN